MNGVASSAVMRRVYRLVTGCCYCGSLYHNLNDCPWRDGK